MVDAFHVMRRKSIQKPEGVDPRPFFIEEAGGMEIPRSFSALPAQRFNEYLDLRISLERLPAVLPGQLGRLPVLLSQFSSLGV
jgi:hypothetical protein